MPKKDAEPERKAPPPPPKKPHLFIQRGFCLRPKFGGGRIPCMISASALDLGTATHLIGKERERITSLREWVFESMEKVLDWGVSGHSAPMFHVGHGVSMWERKHLDQALAKKP